MERLKCTLSHKSNRQVDGISDERYSFYSFHEDGWSKPRTISTVAETVVGFLDLKKHGNRDCYSQIDIYFDIKQGHDDPCISVTRTAVFSDMPIYMRTTLVSELEKNLVEKLKERSLEGKIEKSA